MSAATHAVRVTDEARTRTPDAAADLERAATLFRSVPDFPEAGIVFQDVTPLLADAAALRTCVEAMIAPFEGAYDAVAGLDARGFLLAGFAAAINGVGVIPLRKASKLPVATARVDYALEYGTAALEASPELAVPGLRVLLLDDVLATGGTLAAAHELAARCGAVVAGSAVLLELDGLGGHDVVPDAHALFAY